MICVECGVLEVPERKRQGHPRTKCFVCSPPARGSVYDTPALRAELELRSLMRRLIVGHLDKAEREAEEEREKERERMKWLRLHGLCNCGRDYLTVPLEESHECINPLDPEDWYR